MVSRAAQRVYFASALLNFALIATAIGVAAAVSTVRVSVLPPLTALLVKVLVFPEIVGASILLVGMSYFWLGFDPSGWAKKAAWLVLVYVLGLLALPFYYLVVYRRAVSEEKTGVPASAPATV